MSIFDGVGPPGNRDVTVVRGLLAAEIQDALAPEIRRLEALVRSLIPKEYPTPQLTAQVTVDSPQVSVTTPPAEVEVTVPLDGLQSSIDDLRKDVKALAALLGRPVTRTVARDSDGLIERVVESRG